MAVSPLAEGKERHKSVDGELNLVPYIDLLTCMVAFLLITAVWSQLARLSVAQKGQGGELDSVVDHLRIAVAVHDDGFNLIVKDDQKPIALRDGRLDYGRLLDELKAVKRTHPDVSDAQILSADGVIFDKVVQTMDTAMAAGFPDLSLLDVGDGL